MIIFKPNDTLEVVQHPSRMPSDATQQSGTYLVTVNVDVYNKSTREHIQFTNQIGSFANGVISFTLDPFIGAEANQYFIRCYDSTTSNSERLLFTSNAFCTNQIDLQDYEMLVGQYNEAPTTPNYIKY